MMNRPGVTGTMHRFASALLIALGIFTGTASPANATTLTSGQVTNQRAAMHTSAVNDIQLSTTAPHYTIVGTVNPTTRILTATQTLVYTNRSASKLTSIGMRLYANLTDVGGRTTVNNVRVNGTAATPTYGPQRFFMSIPLATPLAAGKSVSIQMGFTTIAPTNSDTNLFGTMVSDGTTLSLPYAYPMVAFLRGGVWDTAIPDSKGDIVTSEMSLYDVRLTGPLTGYTFVSTGSTTTTIKTRDTQTVQIYSGLQRDFAFALTKLTKKSQTVAGTTINVYGPASRAAVTTTALAAAVASIPIFNTNIGQYPYKELDIISVDAGDFWGIEFPGFVLIEQDQYTNNPNFEPLIVHEVGHQWFYNVIGNDVQRDAFVDEGLTNYTELLYSQARNRPTAATETLAYWRDDLAALRAAGNDAVVDQPMSDMTDDQYTTLSYSKAALYIHAVRLQIGEKAFFTALKNYFTASKYRIVDGTAFRSAAESACTCSLTTLYTKWILQK
jgi:hypothetical protein